MFSTTVYCGSRLYDWKMKPRYVLRTSESWSSSICGDVLVAEEVLAAGRPVEAAEQVEQGGLAGAGRAHEGDEVAFLDGQGDAAKGGDDDRFQVVVLDQIDDASDGVHGGSEFLVRVGEDCVGAGGFPRWRVGLTSVSG